MDVASLYSEIGRLLSDPNNNRWSKATLLTRINEAQRQILRYTNAIKTREDLTPVAGTAAYSLDTDTMDIIRVYIKNSSGSWKELDGVSEEELNFHSPNWRNLTNGEPIGYTWNGTDQQITLVPAPDSTWAQTDGLQVWEVQVPAALTATTDVPFASNTAMIPYHMAIAYWVAAQCWMDDGTPESLSKSKFHRSGTFKNPGNFENEIKAIWGKFDSPQDIPARIMWRPQGGRATKAGVRTKSNPFMQ